MDKDEENIYNLAYAMGYKPRSTTAASVDLEVFQLVPSKLTSNGYSHDYSYTLDINPNSTFVSTEGPYFYLTNAVRFDFSSSIDPTTVTVYQYTEENNPEYYLLKKSVKAISGEVKEQTFSFGSAERFKTLTLFD